MIRHHVRFSSARSILCVGLLAFLGFTTATRAQAPAQHPSIQYFAVGPDEALGYPSTLVTLPDEHTTFIPPSNGFPPPLNPNTYLVFAASSLGNGIAGTVVLQTTDFLHFDFATALGYDEQVMTPPVPFLACNPVYDNEFDENYAAPGTVIQDPTRPPGHLMMFYEAENHCPGGHWQQPFYATIGFARSSDNGKTWPAPINSEFGGKDRYPVLKLPAPEPASEPSPAPMGNAIPAAIIDKDYVYVTYVTPQGPGATSDGLFRIARAKLGDDRSDDDARGAADDARGHDRDHRLHFLKWYNGAFSEAGIGGNDSGVLPQRGCPGYQAMPSITRNDDLGLFLLTYICVSESEGVAAWYYSTATSLEKEDWTPPRLIINSQFSVTVPCPGLASGGQFDGWYPSFVSPGAAQGHTKTTGRVYFMNGCDTGLHRSFMTRGFLIATGP